MPTFYTNIVAHTHRLSQLLSGTFHHFIGNQQVHDNERRILEVLSGRMQGHCGPYLRSFLHPLEEEQELIEGAVVRQLFHRIRQL